jgi:DNA-binding PadR family transcriptional regulator
MMQRKRGLKMAVMWMLSNGPKNGVELMNEMENVTQGWWRPSPGSIYPLLDQLATEGVIKKRDDGRYELTESATEEMDWGMGSSFRKRQSVDEMMTEVSGFVSYIEELNRSDPAKAAAYRDKMKELAERLSALARSSGES